MSTTSTSGSIETTRPLRAPTPSAQLPPLASVELVPIDRCNLCGESRRARILSCDHWTSSITGPRPIHAAVCSACGLIYLEETLPVTILEHPSKHGGGFTYGEIPTREICERRIRAQLERADAMVRYLADELESLPGLKAIDILSETGGFVHALRDAGADAEGLEPSTGLSAFAIEHTGVPMHRILLQDFVGPETRESYDLVTAMRVVNHFADARGTLCRINELLKTGGHVLLEVLNFPHALSRKPLRSCMHVDHPYMFTTSSLCAYLAATGFEVVALERDSDKRHEFLSMNHIHALARKVKSKSPSATPATPVLPDVSPSVEARFECLAALAQFHSTRVDGN